MRDMDSARLRVVCYVRVSTREQAEKGYSVSEQQERLKAYCLAKDWVVAQVITDPGFSGAKLERPGMQQLISLVQAKKCDAVLVWKLDRLSRSQKDTLYLIEDVFLKNGCAFVSMNENFDTSTAFGRAMIGILSVFAQLEREQIRERMACRSGKGRPLPRRRLCSHRLRLQDHCRGRRWACGERVRGHAGAGGVLSVPPRLAGEPHS